MAPLDLLEHSAEEPDAHDAYFASRSSVIESFMKHNTPLRVDPKEKELPCLGSRQAEQLQLRRRPEDRR